MFSLLQNFSSSLINLLKYNCFFIYDNIFIILILLLIFSSLISKYIRQILKLIEEQKEMKMSSNKSELIKNILLNYHDEQIRIINDIFNSSDIDNIINNNSDNTSSASSSEYDDNTESEEVEEVLTELDKEIDDKVILDNKKED